MSNILKDNLITFRNMHGYTQEEIAERIGISRQAYAKWEAGSTIPDIEKCSLLADVYEIPIDSLVGKNVPDTAAPVTRPPIGKNIWGTITIGERGQIIIPKAVRNLFGLSGGQRLIVLTDEKGIALIPDETLQNAIRHMAEKGVLP